MVVTINDVAKKAGVAPSTVTKALKNYPGISQKTREKIKKIAKDLNYQPNYAASALSSKKTDRVALYININNYEQHIDEINMQYLLGAFDMSSDLKLDIITIFDSMVKGKTVDEVTRYLTSQGITGIVIYGINKSDLIMHEIIASQKFKIVVIDAPLTNESTTSINIDNALGQYEVAKKIIDPKYIKKVLYIAGKKNGYVTDARLKGIERLQQEYQLDLDIIYGDFSEKSAYDITLRVGSQYDVIVCACDLMAIGAINALKEMNIFRRVCGFDGIKLLGYAAQNVFTCRQNFYQLSTRAMEEVHALLQGNCGKEVIIEHEVCTMVYHDVIY